jgi:hypothetical protein
LLDAVRRGELDRTPQPGQPLDILVQQVVAACVTETWDEDRLYERLRRAWPYRDLSREDFDAAVALHTEGRTALLHRDGVHGRLRATKRARITALTAGGAIPDTGQYRVELEPEGTLVGMLDEDFAVESNGGDIIQLGNASWRILRVQPGVVRVADAHGMPPTVPFWLGEAPARTLELSTAVARIREHGRDAGWLEHDVGLSHAAATQLSEYLEEGARTLGAIPTPAASCSSGSSTNRAACSSCCTRRSGGRINRAWGLALRKRFCVGFGFELQAAANEDAILISLGPQHSFPLADVFDYLHPNSAKDVLVQALLAAPMFGTRWRWNVTRALLLPRTQQGGRRVPTPILRMRAEDLLVRAFPQVLACPETLPPGELPVPWDHPMVRQTLEDCLTEAMDLDGFLDVLRGLRSGEIEKVAVDTTEPSAFARGILSANPYTFLDDAPLEERRSQAVMTRRALDPKTADTLGALDPDAIARVREEAWPDAQDMEEVHEALLWMGYVTTHEAADSGWTERLEALRAAGRAALEPSDDGGRWFATEASREPASVLRGRLEALGPIVVTAHGVDSETTPPLATVTPDLATDARRARIARCRAALPDRRPRGVVRAAPARAHPSLHAGSAAPRDRARDVGRAVAVPRLLAACRSRVPARRTARHARGGAQARGIRDPGVRMGAAHPAHAAARLPTRVAGPAHADGRGRVGTAVGRGQRVRALDARVPAAARGSRDVARARRPRTRAGAGAVDVCAHDPRSARDARRVVRAGACSAARDSCPSTSRRGSRSSSATASSRATRSAGCAG